MPLKQKGPRRLGQTGCSGSGGPAAPVLDPGAGVPGGSVNRSAGGREPEGEISILTRGWLPALFLSSLLPLPSPQSESRNTEAQGHVTSQFHSVQWLNLARTVCVSDCGSRRRFCN